MLEKLVEQAVWEAVVGKQRGACHLSRILLVCQQSCCQHVASPSVVGAYSGFLSHSQHMQPPSLFTNFSQESLESWPGAQGLLPTEICKTTACSRG